MTFLLRTLRDWFVTLEAIALQNPALLNIPPKLIRIHTHDQIFFFSKSWQLPSPLPQEGTEHRADLTN
jgi:hypothetical protein